MLSSRPPSPVPTIIALEDDPVTAEAEAGFEIIDRLPPRGRRRAPTLATDRSSSPDAKYSLGGFAPGRMFGAAVNDRRSGNGKCWEIVEIPIPDGDEQPSSQVRRTPFHPNPHLTIPFPACPSDPPPRLCRLPDLPPAVALPSLQRRRRRRLHQALALRRLRPRRRTLPTCVPGRLAARVAQPRRPRHRVAASQPRARAPRGRVPRTVALDLFRGRVSPRPRSCMNASLGGHSRTRGVRRVGCDGFGRDGGVSFFFLLSQSFGRPYHIYVQPTTTLMSIH